METITLKVMKVGNSIGAIIPADVVKKEHIKVGEELTVTIQKKENVLKKLFGAHPSKKATEELRKEFRKEMESKWMK